MLHLLALHMIMIMSWFGFLTEKSLISSKKLLLNILEKLWIKMYKLL